MVLIKYNASNEKQSSRGVLRKRYSENMHQIYRGTKRDFNKIALSNIMYLQKSDEK